MPNVADSTDKIQVEETVFNYPNGEGLYKKITGAINFLLNNAQEIQVGDEKRSLLTESQFRAQMLDDATAFDPAVSKWSLADGRNIIGSEFATKYSRTTLFDERMFFARATNSGSGNDPNGDLPFGTNENDSLVEHVHPITSIALSNGVAGISGQDVDNQDDESTAIPFDMTKRFLSKNLTNPSGGVVEEEANSTEVRPANVHVNVFIRINK